MGNVVLDVDHMIYCEKFSKFCDLSREEIFKRIVDTRLEDNYEKGIISSRSFFNSVVEILKLDIAYESFIEIYSDIFTENKEVSEIVYFLKKKVKILLISNTNEPHFSLVSRKFKVIRQFDEYILSYKTGFRKPQEEIYLIALEKMNCKPKEVLYIDDIKDFVKVAQKLGINSVLFDSAKNLGQELLKYFFV